MHLISIHAPPRGATSTAFCLRRQGTYFNSRPSARGDPMPMWFSSVSMNFNSRPSARGDAFYFPFCRGYKFQFTPLREGRPKNAIRMRKTSHFNSRPSARGDWTLALTSAARTFQFTPLREGRLAQRGRQRQRVLISIHAPPRGATLRRTRFWRLAKYFNSRPSARGDSKRYAISANLLFNPYKSAWLNNNATQFVEIILVIFHRIIA